MNTVKKIPDGYHSITPYLSLVDAASAIKFYQQAFGAKVIGQISMPDGKVGHAELQIGDSKLMLAEEMPMWGNKSPATLGGSGVDIALYVNDVDATVARALEVGATVVEPVKDEFYGDRRGMLTDPYGHRWHILTHIEDVSFVEMQKRSDAMFAAKR
jgi:PhnB protein